jgi:hypothetical protein
MKKNMESEEHLSLVMKLEADMFTKYGPLLTGDSLREALGYRSMKAMHQAFLRGTVPVPVFNIKNRRGKFALVQDVAIWLAEQRSSIPG